MHSINSFWTLIRLLRLSIHRNMDNSLHHRFGKYLAPLNLFLQCYGVDLHQLSPTSETHRNLIRLWGWVFLLIQIVGTGGQFINRIPSFTMNVENINRLLSRTNMLVTCLMTTSFIFFKAASRIVSFINSLQMIDRSLNRPDLSSLYRSSIIGVLWILITVLNYSVVHMLGWKLSLVVFRQLI